MTSIVYGNGFLRYLPGDLVQFEYSYDGRIYLLTGYIKTTRTVTWLEVCDDPQYWQEFRYVNDNQVRTPRCHRKFCLDYDDDVTSTSTIYPVGYEITLHRNCNFGYGRSFSYDKIPPSTLTYTTDTFSDNGILQTVYVPVRHVVGHVSQHTLSEHVFCKRLPDVDRKQQVSYIYRVQEQTSIGYVDQYQQVLGLVVDYGYAGGKRYACVYQQKVRSLGDKPPLPQTKSLSYEFDPVSWAYSASVIHLVPIHELNMTSLKYIDALQQLIKDLRLTRRSMKFTTTRNNRDGWYGFTYSGAYVGSDERITMPTENNIFLQRYPPESDRNAQAKMISSEDVVFGRQQTSPNSGKSSLSCFAAQDYPGFLMFYNFVMIGTEHPCFAGMNWHDIVTSMNHRGQHTLWSKLVDGYFNKFCHFDEVKMLKNIYCWNK
jgi:hypothetical protein